MLVSRRVFTTSGGTQVRAELDLGNMKFAIKDAVSGETVIAGGKTKNRNVLKIQCKDALINLGVEFAEEDRAERTARA